MSERRPGTQETTVTGPPTVSVIVPAYNEVGTIEPCLDLLLDQTVARERYEVIVVDNGSTDGTASVVAEYPVQLLSVPDGGQFAARNRGIERANGEVFAFTDADVRVDPDWIAAGRRALDRAGDPAVVYGLVRPAIDGDVTPWATYDVVHSFGGVRKQTWNLFTTATVFDRVGTFDARYLSGGDVEWADRVAAAGVPVHTDATVAGSHPPRDSPGDLFLRHVRLGYGGGQRLRANEDPTVTLVAKEPLRLATWYRGMLGRLREGSDWIALSGIDRLLCAAMLVPLGLGMAYGRLRGLLETTSKRPVGDYR